jgi:hypothetical protein
MVDVVWVVCASCPVPCVEACEVKACCEACCEACCLRGLGRQSRNIRLR